MLISCVYRAPGQRLSTFCDSLEPILNNDRNNKTMFVCGDVNIDLLQHESQDSVRHFLDLMYGIGLYPLITKPTRITRTTTTLIDNIFTTDIEQHYACGLLINYISDHLPIFVMCKNNIKNKDNENKHNKRCIRQIKKENITLLNCELGKFSWEHVLDKNNVNEAYDTFISDFTCIFDKCCPVKEVNVNTIRHEPKKLWLTSSLVNACHKK